MLITEKLIKEIIKYQEFFKAGFLPENELRFVNWYIQHSCDLDCSYCRVPQQSVKIMGIEQRRDALQKTRQLCGKRPIISLLGGEPTLKPDFLIEAIKDASASGFLVNLVTNGWGLTPELIRRLSDSGLHYLAISVDSDDGAEKSNLEKALSLQQITKQERIIPVINTVITNNTNPAVFKEFAKTIINNDIFLSPIACSPEVPGGVFSNALAQSVPSGLLLKEIVPWLAWKKLSTGRVTASFSYLWTLFNSGVESDGKVKLWHCSPRFRSNIGEPGRGYLTLDSDGFIGLCQEFPRLLNISNVPTEQLSLKKLDKQFSITSQNCPGCLHNCYVMEEEIRGLKALAEVPTLIQFRRVKPM